MYEIFGSLLSARKTTFEKKNAYRKQKIEAKE